MIVSNGAFSVSGGRGDDKICMTGKEPGNLVFVDGNLGDDSIVVKGRINTQFSLGPGADRLIGGPGKDIDDSGAIDQEKDVLRLGGGDDFAFAPVVSI